MKNVRNLESENADIDATVLKQWIETAERVALGEMWKVMLEHDFFSSRGTALHGRRNGE